MCPFTYGSAKSSPSLLFSSVGDFVRLCKYLMQSNWLVFAFLMPFCYFSAQWGSLIQALVKYPIPFLPGFGLIALYDLLKQFLNSGTCSDGKLEINYFYFNSQSLNLNRPSPHGADSELSFYWLIMMASGPQPSQRTCHLDREWEGFGKA